MGHATKRETESTSSWKVDVILESLYEVILEQSLIFEFETTHNQAEYKALLVQLRLA